MHKELVCEECCDLSHHKDHNNQILLLKAAAQNFLADIDYWIGLILQNRPILTRFKDFNLRNQIRKSIIEFFDNLRLQIEILQKQKLDEFNKVFRDSHFVNIKEKAADLAMKTDIYGRFFAQKRQEFEGRNFVAFLSQTNGIPQSTLITIEIESVTKQTDKLIKEC